MSEQEEMATATTGSAAPVIATPPTRPLSPYSAPAMMDNRAMRSATTATLSTPPLVLEGQFHEMVAELRTLQQQSREIEHRLSTLREIAERIEHDYLSRGVHFEDMPTIPGA